MAPEGHQLIKKRVQAHFLAPYQMFLNLLQTDKFFDANAASNNDRVIFDIARGSPKKSKRLPSIETNVMRKFLGNTYSKIMFNTPEGVHPTTHKIKPTRKS